MPEIVYKDQQVKDEALNMMGVMANKKCIDLYEKYSEEEIQKFCGIIQGLWRTGKLIIETMQTPVKD